MLIKGYKKLYMIIYKEILRKMLRVFHVRTTDAALLSINISWKSPFNDQGSSTKPMIIYY